MDYSTWKQAAMELQPHLTAIAAVEKKYQVVIHLVISMEDPPCVYAYCRDPDTGAHYSVDVNEDGGVTITHREEGIEGWETIRGTE